jgi:hypothetical protein
VTAKHPWKRGDIVAAPDVTESDGLTNLVVYDTTNTTVSAVDPSLNLCLQWRYTSEGWTVFLGRTDESPENGQTWVAAGISRYPGPNHWEEI